MAQQPRLIVILSEAKDLLLFKAKQILWPRQSCATSG
jgi:hypothetical protein